MIPGQMSIFDSIQEPERKLPAEIEELEEKLEIMFKKYKLVNTSYRIWEHVASMGYRYAAWIQDVTKEDVEGNIDALNSLSSEDLDVSVNVLPELFGKKGCYRLFVSTFWKKKNRKMVF